MGEEREEVQRRKGKGGKGREKGKEGGNGLLQKCLYCISQDRQGSRVMYNHAASHGTLAQLSNYTPFSPYIHVCSIHT